MSRESRGGGRGDEILDLVKWQVNLGPRVPGSDAHRALMGRITDDLSRFADEVFVQDFPITLNGGAVPCANAIGIFRAKKRALKAPLLLGTHYDTRIRADREEDAKRREMPIPGADWKHADRKQRWQRRTSVPARAGGRRTVPRSVRRASQPSRPPSNARQTQRGGLGRSEPT